MATQQIQQDIGVSEEAQMPYESDPNVEEISVAELWAEIDRKARQHLNLSGEEFAHLYRQGVLEDIMVVAELGLLLRCIDDTFIPA